MKQFQQVIRETIFSKIVRAGRRTYFFDVKETKFAEKYITITESKKRFNNENGKFYYEKHKIFLYQEDFEKFTNSLNGIINFINTGEKPETDFDDNLSLEFSDVDFENLGTNQE